MFSIASSTADLRPKALPFRKPPSAVITKLAEASSMRLRSDSAENPPNTTECGAPIRAQANIDMTASGIIGMYIATRSPDLIPNSVNAFAA